MIRNGFASALGACTLATLCAACVQMSFERETRLEPVEPAALAELVPGTSDLQAALDRLGPPIFAWELPDQRTALAWGWYHARGWRIKASDANKSGVSLSFNYDSVKARLRGAVLFFDADWKLTAVREGVLNDLRDASRVRPEALDAE
ncbi:MAG TPA: hypothetical protein VM509_03815 [Planctomycetota bacterium]|nr:hypothetical protein [Planctomycetota bacterium]